MLDCITDDGAFHAARDVTLDVAQGEFLVLLGPSGCGKTTTLRMVAGLIEPSAGTIRIGGRDDRRETRAILSSRVLQ